MQRIVGEKLSGGGPLGQRDAAGKVKGVHIAVARAGVNYAANHSGRINEVSGAAKSAEWSLTNALRLELADQGTRVSALHVGFMDTDMTRRLDVPKASPADIAKLAIDGLEAGDSEIVADETSRQVLTGLSAGVAGL
jgi:NAD(P)-dependent dehydrogenase (short-subunit alcohol dehydrogenase family)